LRPTPPTDPYVTDSVIRFVSNGPCGPRTCRGRAHRRHDCCCPSGRNSLHPDCVQSAPVSLTQVMGSKSLLPFLGTDVHTWHCLPAALRLLSWVPWASVPHASRQGFSPAPRYCALLRLPSSFPVGPLLAPFRYLGLTRLVSCPSRLASGLVRLLAGRPVNARVLVVPVTLIPAVAPKETGGSPEFPDYPFVHMPRSQTPVVSRSLALARTGLLPSNAFIPSALGSIVRTYPDVHHYTVFGAQFRGLCSRLTSASDTAFPQSPFGSAADLMASL